MALRMWRWQSSDMGGMMSQADMDALKNASGVQAAKLYLTGMITHHQGALTMAQDEVKNGQFPRRRGDGQVDPGQPAEARSTR